MVLRKKLEEIVNVPVELEAVVQESYVSPLRIHRPTHSTTEDTR